MKCYGLRHPRTTQERRYNCYMMYPEIEDALYRGKRSHKYLPTTRDDIWICNSKCWKDKTKRKKQYRQNKRKFNEAWFDGTSREQYLTLYGELLNKGVYFESKSGWWSKPAIDRKCYLCWWE